MKKPTLLLLSILAALLLSIPFFQWGNGLFGLVAFVPLLLIEQDVAEKKAAGQKARLLPWALLSFALFVAMTTYWVYWATWVGIIASIVVNAGYMSLVFWAFHLVKRRTGKRLGYSSFLFFWLCFEFLYLRAQINFPWLILGNSFAKEPALVQWYELTGPLGGSLWILLTNLLVFRLSAYFVETGRRKQLTKATKAAKIKAFYADNKSLLLLTLLLLIIPISASLLRFYSYEEKGKGYEVLVLQPNIDPYLKFNDMPQSLQTAHLLAVADSLCGPETDYIVGPETFLNNGIWEERMQLHEDVRQLYAFLSNYPNAKLVIGATTYRLYSEPSSFTETCRPIGNRNERYDSFNTAFQLDSTSQIPVYHKSLLVAGVETMPHARLLGFLEKLTVRLGGTFRSHGTQKERSAFASPQDGTRVGPVICWESVFSEFVTGYVKDAGANFLFIITNDGWWKNTPGHKQHNDFAHLRAIENRRSIARSANTGISSLIDQRGREIERLGWWKRGGIKAILHKNEQLTFYTRHGDYIGRVSVFLSLILLLYSLLIRFIRK